VVWRVCVCWVERGRVNTQWWPFPIKRRINTELCIDRMAALYIGRTLDKSWDQWGGLVCFSQGPKISLNICCSKAIFGSRVNLSSNVLLNTSSPNDQFPKSRFAWGSDIGPGLRLKSGPRPFFDSPVFYCKPTPLPNPAGPLSSPPHTYAQVRQIKANLSLSKLTLTKCH